jgi:hypothetical protein
VARPEVGSRPITAQKTALKEVVGRRTDLPWPREETRNPCKTEADVREVRKDKKHMLHRAQSCRDETGNAVRKGHIPLAAVLSEIAGITQNHCLTSMKPTPDSQAQALGAVRLLRGTSQQPTVAPECAVSYAMCGRRGGAMRPGEPKQTQGQRRS